MRSFGKDIFQYSRPLFLVALFGVSLATSVLAMGEKPNPKILEIKKQCDALSKETGEQHFYGEGKITFLVDAVPLPEKVSTDKPDDPKGYIAKMDTLPFERTYIRATFARWKAIPPLQKERRYAFCYTIERQRLAAINHPETMLLLEE